MNIKSPQEYLRNLNQIPPQAKQILYSMRKLDQSVLVMHNDIRSKREQVLQLVEQYELRKGDLKSALKSKFPKGRSKQEKINYKAPNSENSEKNDQEDSVGGRKLIEYETDRRGERSRGEIEQIIKSIQVTHRRMLKLTRKKKQLAQKLYNCIDKPTEQLERDLSLVIPEPAKEHKGRKHKKDAAEEYLISEPSYCYCKRPSFGMMIKCGSEKCDTQWFHIDCVQENGKEVEGQWYCKDCRKDRQKRRIR